MVLSGGKPSLEEVLQLTAKVYASRKLHQPASDSGRAFDVYCTLPAAATDALAAYFETAGRALERRAKEQPEVAELLKAVNDEPSGMSGEWGADQSGADEDGYYEADGDEAGKASLRSADDDGRGASTAGDDDDVDDCGGWLPSPGGGARVTDVLGDVACELDEADLGWSAPRVHVHAPARR